jgi:peroxiredoxin
MAESESTGRVRRVFVVALASVATVAAAFILGSHVGKLLVSKGKRDHVQSRELRTKVILDKMENLSIGDTLPDASFLDLDLHVHRLSNLVNDWAVLSFLDPSCGACLDQLDALNAAIKADSLYSHFITLSGTNPLLLKEFEREFCPGVTILYDENREFQNALGVSIAPFNLILHADLSVRKVIVGSMTKSDFDSLLTQYKSDYQVNLLERKLN